MCRVFVITNSSFDLNLSWLKLLADQYNLCRLLMGSLSVVKVIEGTFESVWEVKRLNLIPLLFVVRSNLLKLICDLAINSVRIIKNFTLFRSKKWEKANSFPVNLLASLAPFVLLTVAGVMVLAYFLSYTLCFSEWQFFIFCFLNFLELIRPPWKLYDWYTSVWRKV